MEVKMENEIFCGACGKVAMKSNNSENALSRYCEQSICSGCGTREALEGDFWKDKRTETMEAVNKSIDKAKREISETVGETQSNIMALGFIAKAWGEVPVELMLDDSFSGDEIIELENALIEILDKLRNMYEQISDKIEYHTNDISEHS